MDVNERIRKELAATPAVLFMKGTAAFPQCGFSAQTVVALHKLRARFHYVNIFEDPELRGRSSNSRTGRPTRSCTSTES